MFTTILADDMLMTILADIIKKNKYSACMLGLLLQYFQTYIDLSSWDVVLDNYTFVTITMECGAILIIQRDIQVEFIMT